MSTLKLSLPEGTHVEINLNWDATQGYYSDISDIDEEAVEWSERYEYDKYEKEVSNVE